jgi:hypothetical protein
VRTKLLIALLFLSHLVADNFCYFIPPQGWDIADPSKLSPRVKIAFVGKSTKGLLPSCNLATEKVSISLKDYLAAVKKIHEADPNTKWRDLGAFQTPLGQGKLTEVETKIGAGLARRMQLIVIYEGTAYILTVGALKEEFSKHYQTFEEVLRSLTVTSDLASVVAKEKQTQLKPQMQESWESFQQRVITDFSEMGAYWQILFLQEKKKGFTEISPTDKIEEKT